MKESNAYELLAEKLGMPPPTRLTKILEEAYTAEECELLMELFEPATCAELANRLGWDESNVHDMLESLVSRGALTQGKTKYAFHKSVLAFHHDVFADTGVLPISDKLKQLWSDFFFNEWADKGFLEHYMSFTEKTGRPVFRVWPAMGALELSPNINPEDLLPDENWRLQLENSNRRIVAPCGCIVSWGAYGGECKHPVENRCFANYDNDRGAYYLDKPGRQLVELTLEESLDRVRELEKAGLVHIGQCYCCPDTCEIMFPLNRAQRWDLLGSSRFVPEINEDECSGCQVCVKRCYFDAIEMKKKEGSEKQVASIKKDKCLGCGLCIVTCGKKAMRYILDKPEEHITGGRPPDAKPFSPSNMWGYYDLD